MDGRDHPSSMLESTIQLMVDKHHLCKHEQRVIPDGDASTKYDRAEPWDCLVVVHGEMLLFGW